MTGEPAVDVVVPTIGRSTLAVLLTALGRAPDELGTITVVDDRPDRSEGLDLGTRAPALARVVRVVAGRSAGPASARNIGWRAGTAPWVVFVDDDVELSPGWWEELRTDLAAAPEEVGGVAGRIEVPLPEDRRPTDWERNVAGLAQARWATADMAYRRDVLELVGGFDERFPRAYREDADLALRVLDAGWHLRSGDRAVVHPVRPADRWISVRAQAGNADDPFMWALHGSSWRRRAEAPAGRRRTHLALVASFAVAVGLLACRPRRWRWPAAVAGSIWAAGTARLARDRIVDGPRTRREVTTMAVTSVVIPFAATFHWLRGWAGLVARLRRGGPGSPPVGYPDAVLFDRDATLVVDVPYNGDPDRVVPVPGARAALDRLRARGIAVGLVTNQSGVGRGLVTPDQVDAVNRRVEELLGPFDVIEVCTHAPDVGCSCRKPAPGLVVRAAQVLGAEPSRCVVIGDIGADVDAAAGAGARGILVPTAVTREDEVERAPEVAVDLHDAVDRVLGGAR